MDTNLVLNDSFNELIFEKRHKNYGAFQIRRRYRRNVLIAMLISATSIGSAIGIMALSTEKAHAAVKPGDEEPHVVTVQVQTDPEKPKDEPKPEQTQRSAPIKGSMNTEPTIVDHPVVPPQPGPVGDPNGNDSGTVVVKQDTLKPPCLDCDTAHVSAPVTWADTMPECPTCDPFFQKNIKYPEVAKENNIQGTVWISFIVDTHGEVKDVQVAKGVHPLLDNEALRVAKMMPRWTPGRDHGKPVNFLYRKPIRFILQ